MSYSTLVAGPSTNHRRSHTMSASSRPSTRITAEPHTSWAGSPELIGPATITSSTRGIDEGEQARDERAQGAQRQARDDRLGERDETRERSQGGGAAVVLVAAVEVMILVGLGRAGWREGVAGHGDRR